MKLGTCQLISCIAHGGIADIYLAKAKTAKGAEKYLICKCVRQSLNEDNGFLSSIINEAQFSFKIRHPNIVQIFDLCVVPNTNTAFLTMEYLDAQDLHSLLVKASERGERIPISMALYIVQQAALGLHAAHELTDKSGHPINLVHRDISPENILFGSDGSIKISDFGIAQTSASPEVHTDIIEGKTNYMSPEQAWGSRADRRSDIFSLAVVLYETCLGQSMYPDSSPDAALQCARGAVFPLPHEIDPAFPPDLEQILLKALDLDKAVRFDTALNFKLALDNYARSNHIHVTRASWISWLQTYVSFPTPPLPLMRRGEMPPDETSILKPEMEDLNKIEDINATGQISTDTLAEMLRQASASRMDTLAALREEAGAEIDNSPSDTDKIQDIADSYDGQTACSHISVGYASPTYIAVLKVIVFILCIIFIALLILYFIFTAER